MPASNRLAGAPRAGLSLLELCLVLAVVAALLAAAVPALRTVRDTRVKRETRAELVLIARASGEFFHDTLGFPAEVEALRADPGVAGWAGPYLALDRGTGDAGSGSLGLDAWARGVRLAAAGETFVVASAGPDALFGSADDLRVELDVASIRRRITRERLAVLNLAIERYQAEHPNAAALPADAQRLCQTLIAAGCLSASQAFATDAWGSPFVPEPRREGRNLRMRSPNLVPGA